MRSYTLRYLTIVFGDEAGDSFVVAAHRDEHAVGCFRFNLVGRALCELVQEVDQLTYPCGAGGMAEPYKTAG